ncbi:MAG: phenylacetate--CoA ligase family protein [Actinomycetota bacterium]|nr:phenylacetate--CoA ligase family protein [Actinomycetota bacterium]
MTPEQYGRSFDSAIRSMVPRAAQLTESFAERLRGAGLQPEEVVDAASLDRLPVLSKDQLLELQRKLPPFGGLLAPRAPVRRVFQSPGPLYEPELDHADHWRWAPALQAAGFDENDIVLNAAGYHLSPLGAMLEEGVRVLGCRVVPGGVGNLELQVQACADLGVSAYTGLPSYLKALWDRAEGAGIELVIRKAFVTAEPLPPSLREWLGKRLETVLQGYGTAELGNLGYECEQMEGLHVPTDALVEVCELDSGEARWDGSVGQVVATLFHPEYPLVRLGTGDLSAFLLDPCPCGRPAPRLKGWMGRMGDAVKVRGMFLHPRQVQVVMGQVPQVEGYRFLVERVEHRDLLRCQVVGVAGTVPQELAARVKEQIRSGLRFDAEVQVVDALPEEAAVIEDLRSWE